MSATAFQRMRREKTLEKALNEKVKESADENTSELANLSLEELKLYAEEKGIDIGQSTSQKGILKKIQEAEKTE